MNKEEINDLKQFITTTVREELVAPIDGLHQEISDVKTDLNHKIDGMIERFDENDLKQDEILNAIGEINEKQFKTIKIHADHIDNHERRIVKLEKRTA